jgi:hypothetical protein
LSEAQKKDLHAAEIEETAEAKTPTDKPVEDEASTPTIPQESEVVEAIPPRPLGPESEGMEVITGPTKVPPREGKDGDGRLSSEGNEYAKELVNQFSRPQTLLLKDTMPMPSGVLVMPPMPPMPQPHGQAMIAPDAVNFEDPVKGPVRKTRYKRMKACRRLPLPHLRQKHRLIKHLIFHNNRRRDHVVPFSVIPRSLQHYLRLRRESHPITHLGSILQKRLVTCPIG